MQKSHLFLVWSLLSAAGLLVLLAPARAAPEEGPAPAAKGEAVPVVVELFTSEGCSSCPPADLVLADLAGQPIPGVQVIVLGEHVDYWNYIGWKDPFSARLFSDRQGAYATQFGTGRIYTPQAVVQGRIDVLGSSGTELRRTVAGAASLPHGRLALKGLAQSGNKITASAEGSDIPEEGDLFVAIAESHLVSKVTAGENAGRTLPHAGVVRLLERAGKTRGGAVTATVALDLQPEWKRENLALVAFVQRPGGPVVAATSVALK